MLRTIKKYFRLRKYRKKLLDNKNSIHNISDAYLWIKTFNELCCDADLSKHIKITIPFGDYVNTRYGNFANLMDAVNEASNFYRYGNRLTIQPLPFIEKISYTQFLKNSYNNTIDDTKVVDYIRTFIPYYVNDLLEYSIDINSTTVNRTRLLIIDIVVFMQAILDI